MIPAVTNVGVVQLSTRPLSFMEFPGSSSAIRSTRSILIRLVQGISRTGWITDSFGIKSADFREYRSRKATDKSFATTQAEQHPLDALLSSISDFRVEILVVISSDNVLEVFLFGAGRDSKHALRLISETPQPC